MTKEELVITIEGLPNEEGNVRLGEFALALDKLRSALLHANQHISGERRALLHITTLSLNSPARVGVENIRDTPGLLTTFGKALTNMGDGSAAELIGYAALEDVLEVTKRVVLDRVERIVINGASEPTLLNAEYAGRIERELAPSASCRGTVEGTLEALNLHDGANRFTIFPASLDRGITCYIPKELHDAALAAVRRKVAVSGTLKFRARDMVPCEVLVEELVAFPPDDQLPTFRELRGAEPGLTGDLSTEEYLEEIRNAWT